MHPIDAIILAALAYGLYKGFRKGLVHMILSVAGLILAVFAAGRFSARLVPYLRHRLHWQEASVQWVAYALVFLGVLIVMGLLSRLLDKLLKKAGLGWFNRLSGAALSAAKYLLILGLLLRLGQSLQQRFGILPPDYARDARLHEPLVRATDSVLSYVGRLHLDSLAREKRAQLNRAADRVMPPDSTAR